MCYLSLTISDTGYHLHSDYAHRHRSQNPIPQNLCPQEAFGSLVFSSAACREAENPQITDCLDCLMSETLWSQAILKAQARQYDYHALLGYRRFQTFENLHARCYASRVHGGISVMYRPEGPTNYRNHFFQVFNLRLYLYHNHIEAWDC